MTKKIIIEKFGPIKKAELDFKSVLVLIGPQSSGKSTIAKLTTIFRDFSFVFKEKKFETYLTKHNIAGFLNKDTFIEFTSHSYRFVYKNGTGKFFYNKESEIHAHYTLFKEYLKNKPQHLSKLQNISKELSDIKLKIKSYQEATESFDKGTIFFDSIDKQLNSLEEETSINEIYLKKVNDAADNIKIHSNVSNYIPAERQIIPIISESFISLTNQNIPLPGNILDFGEAFEKARKNLDEIKLDVLGIKYRYIKGEDRIYLNSRKFIKLSESSSGYQALIPLMLVILNSKNNLDLNQTFVVEEPELNLYPETQRLLIQFLSENCCKDNFDNSIGNELIITTHSPYILSAFNNLLMAHKVGGIKESETNKIIPENSWINPSNFSAYSVSEGIVNDIFNNESGLIDEDKFDDTSDIIIGEFDQLMELL